jgi:hypothetical protein
MVATGALVLLAACGYQPPPVTVSAPPGELALLEGEWRGEYLSRESGRAGSILFVLEAGQDTARGDVLMVPGPGLLPDRAADRPMGEVIGIRFVRLEHGTVRGVLDPYRDPECGCRLTTTFAGTLRGDTISGTYSSRHLEGGLIQHGQWRVLRHS